MKFSVLINNYNYGVYLRECVDSLLAQTRLPDEIIVVNDGSTDDSLAILEKCYGRNPLVKVISQPNQGQMSAIATGIENAHGDILCLLDADDHYKPEYLAELESLYQKSPHVDLTFCRFEGFGQEPFIRNEDIVWLSPQTDYDYGYTALLTYFGDIHWIGSFTTTLSLRARLARGLYLRETMAAFRHIPDRVDFLILIRASLIGARKYYLHKALVEYRHNPQGYSRGRRDKNLRIKANFFDGILTHYHKQHSFISDSMKCLLHDESTTIPTPLKEHLRQYKRAMRLSLMPRFLHGFKRQIKNLFRRA